MNTINTFKKDYLIKININHQGAPIVNCGFIKEASKNIVALEIDLKSKYCEVQSVSGGEGEPCSIFIVATRQSVSLNKNHKKYDPTEIEFTDFIGWDIFTCNLTRYTLKVCLIKNKPTNEEKS